MAERRPVGGHLPQISACDLVFRLRRRPLSVIRGRKLVLVDDVVTTGATAAACSATLLRAGAGAVDVLVLARALRPSG